MKKQIFIVEDEMVIVRELEIYLQDMGYEVCGFSTTAEEVYSGPNCQDKQTAYL